MPSFIPAHLQRNMFFTRETLSPWPALWCHYQHARLPCRKKYCHRCKKGYSLGDLCKLCDTHKTVLSKNGNLVCTDCNRFFKSDGGYGRHKTSVGTAKSQCRSLVKCQACQRVVTRASLNDHHCRKIHCSSCSKSNLKTTGVTSNPLWPEKPLSTAQISLTMT